MTTPMRVSCNTAYTVHASIHRSEKSPCSKFQLTTFNRWITFLFT